MWTFLYLNTMLLFPTYFCFIHEAFKNKFMMFIAMQIRGKIHEMTFEISSAKLWSADTAQINFVSILPGFVWNICYFSSGCHFFCWRLPWCWLRSWSRFIWYWSLSLSSWFHNNLLFSVISCCFGLDITKGFNSGFPGPCFICFILVLALPMSWAWFCPVLVEVFVLVLNLALSLSWSLLRLWTSFDHCPSHGHDQVLV